MSTQPKRILFAGGGTGGHVFPIVNIINQTLATQEPVLLFWAGQKNSLEEKEAQKIREVRFMSIVSGKLRREKSLSAGWKNIKDIFRLMRGIVQAWYILWKNQIDVVFCKGGYVALPVVIASYATRARLVVHESDTSMGLSNHYAARCADTVFVAFEGVHPQGELVGQLLSPQIAQSSPRKSFEDVIGREYDDTKTYVLLMGGSQGSQSLYLAFQQCLQLGQGLKDFHFVMIRGILNQGLQIIDSYDNVTMIDFADQEMLATLYQYTDVAITRAGTTSLSEQKLRDIKLVIVPIPWTHDQADNAAYYVDHYDDVLIYQDEQLAHHLQKTLIGLRGYHKDLTESERAKQVARPKERVVASLLFTN